MLASDHQACLDSKFDTFDSPRIETLAGKFHRMASCNEHILLDLELSRGERNGVPVEAIAIETNLQLLINCKLSQ